MNNKEMIIKAKSALLPNGWSDNVYVQIGNQGKISGVSFEAIEKKDAKTINVDFLLPAVANLHSHSFQRAMAGLTEKKGKDGNDSFWTWRDLMYKFLDLLTPEDILSITAFGQMEMLKAGFSSVAEFHYLHHQKNGNPYNSISQMSQSIIEASKETGIGLCLLPVLYERGGCDNRPLTKGQKRFGNNFDQFVKLINEVKIHSENTLNCNLGVAAHSLRAVRKESLEQIEKLLNGPIHIHAAEQDQEVDEILSAYGQRPVEWLLNNMDINKRWCLIHCTQMTEDETIKLSKSGAVAGLCPVTEANLGDGIFNGLDFFNNNGTFGVGTDSNINISLIEELKMLEYSQRLSTKKRAVLSDKNRSTGRVLFDKSLFGGSLATQRETGEISIGKTADLISLDHNIIDLNERNKDTILDYLVFSSQGNAINNVWSAGSLVIDNGRHFNQEMITKRYKNTMTSLREKT